MRARTETTKSISATDRVIDRLPVFSALAVLGMNYAEIGRLLGVSTQMVIYWATGRKPLSRVRRIALEYLAWRLSSIARAKYPLNNVYAKRAEIAIEAARRWSELSAKELSEETGGVYAAEELQRGYELGERIIARLEAQ
jgi:hypothetical protein